MPQKSALKPRYLYEEMDPTPRTQGIPIPEDSSCTALGQCYFKFMDGIGIQILRVDLCPLISRNSIWGGENPASGNWWDFERKMKGYLGFWQVGWKRKKQLFKELETSGRFLKCHGISWVFLCHHKLVLGPLLKSLPGEHPKSSGIGGTPRFSCPKTHPRAIGFLWGGDGQLAGRSGLWKKYSQFWVAFVAEILYSGIIQEVHSSLYPWFFWNFEGCPALLPLVFKVKTNLSQNLCYLDPSVDFRPDNFERKTKVLSDFEK